MKDAVEDAAMDHCNLLEDLCQDSLQRKLEEGLATRLVQILPFAETDKAVLEVDRSCDSVSIASFDCVTSSHVYTKALYLNMPSKCDDQ